MIEWLMELPPIVQSVFQHEVQEYEERQRMPFYDYHQKRAMLELIESSLEAKFGEDGLKLLPAIRELSNAEKYIALNRTIATATTLDEVRRACQGFGAAVEESRQ